MANPARTASLARMILAGLVLTGTPWIAVASYMRAEPSDVVFSMPATIEHTDFGARLKLPISTLDITTLAGDDDVAVGDVVYVHNRIDRNQLSYPYAISQNRAEASTGSVTLRAIITEKRGDILGLDYQFEDHIGSHAAGADVVTEVSVNRRAVARLRALTVDGRTRRYGVTEKPVLLGRSKNGATTAPATYPAK